MGDDERTKGREKGGIREYLEDYIDPKVLELIEFVIRMIKKAELGDKIEESWEFGTPFGVCMAILSRLHQYKAKQRNDDFVSFLLKILKNE